MNFPERTSPNELADVRGVIVMIAHHIKRTLIAELSSPRSVRLTPPRPHSYSLRNGSADSFRRLDDCVFVCGLEHVPRLNSMELNDRLSVSRLLVLILVLMFYFDRFFCEKQNATTTLSIRHSPSAPVVTSTMAVRLVSLRTLRTLQLRRTRYLVNIFTK